MQDYFEQLKNELEAIKQLGSRSGANGFFGQEALRFYSIAGTLLESFSCDKNAGVDERYITHILSRTILENYFWIIYLFDAPAQTASRYASLVDAFKLDYHKLLNEPLLPHKDKLEPSDPSWSSLNRAMDVNSMLAQVKNDYGDRLSYLYFIYRLTSFDTHGKSLDTIFQEAFGKQVNFPVLDVGYAIKLIANQYMVTLGQLRNAGEI
ncbi:MULTISPECIES: hypothetical protein [Shewanella]|uniref:hypothetical protein n=1 Tax=Shewanella TaxID=22 RepID=UPI000E033E62|nr:MULTISPECIES: hypothetical protein [Shewanella]MCU8010432.1 hypothetical protein [Shewanella sp. SM87]SUI61310.1 Uncharacterised protein [Shewanella baltica]